MSLVGIDDVFVMDTADVVLVAKKDKKGIHDLPTLSPTHSKSILVEISNGLRTTRLSAAYWMVSIIKHSDQEPHDGVTS